MVASCYVLIYWIDNQGLSLDSGDICPVSIVDRSIESATLGALTEGLSIMDLATVISTFLASVGADITAFLGGVSGLLSDRRLKSDVVMVDWSR